MATDDRVPRPQNEEPQPRPGVMAVTTPSAWTQFRAMLRLRISLFQADVLSIIPFFTYPLIYIIILFVVTTGSKMVKFNPNRPTKPVPFYLLVPSGPSYLAGSTADRATSDVLFSQVNWTITAHRQVSEGKWTASMNPNFWHRANSVDDVGTVTSKFLGTVSTLLDAKRPDLNPPLGGYIAHALPSSTEGAFNVSLVSNINPGLNGAFLSPIMLNALTNSVQIATPKPATVSAAANGTKQAMDRLGLLVQQGRSKGNDVVVPWSVQLNAATANFPPLPSEFFDVRAVIVPPLIVYCLYLILLGSTRNMVGERAEGQFSYFVTNGLAPELFYLSAIVAYTYLAFLVIVFSLILVLKTNWIHPFVMLLLLVLFSLYVTSQAALVSFAFSHKNTVPSTLYLIVFALSVCPQVLIHHLGDEIPTSLDSVLTLLLPTYAVTQCFNNMSAAAFKGVDYAPFSSHLPLALLGFLVHNTLNILGTCFLARHVALDPVGAANASSLLAKAWATMSGSHRDPVRDIEQEADSLEDPEVAAERARLQSSNDAADHNDDVIRIQGLCKSFPSDAARGTSRVVLDNLWMSVRRNELFAFLGPNGAGKSTTINILTGLLQPTTGTATVCGHAPTSPAAQRLLGVCPQRDQAYSQLTVYHHLRAMAHIKGIPREAVQDAIDEALAAAELLPFKHRVVGALSGGTRRRMSIAIACLGRPAVVIFDEPTTGVDVATRRSILSLIERLKRHAAVLYVTHGLDEVEQLADRAGLMINGSLVCLGTPRALKARLARHGGHVYLLKVQFAAQADAAAAAGDALVQALDARGARVAVVYRGTARLEGTVELAASASAAQAVGELLAFIKQQRTAWQVTDWSLGEVTLDGLFVRFAKQHRAYQDEERLDD